MAPTGLFAEDDGRYGIIRGMDLDVLAQDLDRGCRLHGELWMSPDQVGTEYVAAG